MRHLLTKHTPSPERVHQEARAKYSSQGQRVHPGPLPSAIPHLLLTKAWIKNVWIYEKIPNVPVSAGSDSISALTSSKKSQVL